MVPGETVWVRRVTSPAMTNEFKKQVFRPKTIPFNPLHRGGEITLKVCQGLGDIFWVYQKFAPYVDAINFEICGTSSDSIIQHRSMDWMDVLPKVKSASFVTVPDLKDYDNLVYRFDSMQETWGKFQAGETDLTYCCNAWLETGTRLDEIDPGSDVLWNAPVVLEEHKVPFKNYMMMFVSSYTISDSKPVQMKSWSLQQWFDYSMMLYEKYKLPIVVVGADFDQPVPNTLSAAYKTAKVPSYLMVQKKPGELLFALKNAGLFVGYQSGLGIMADNFEVPQLMMYFSYLSDMMYSWCQPQHIKTLFQASTFHQTPEQVMSLNLTPR